MLEAEAGSPRRPSASIARVRTAIESSLSTPDNAGAALFAPSSPSANAAEARTSASGSASEATSAGSARASPIRPMARAARRLTTASVSRTSASRSAVLAGRTPGSTGTGSTPGSRSARCCSSRRIMLTLRSCGSSGTGGATTTGGDGGGADAHAPSTIANTAVRTAAAHSRLRIAPS
jgi:hypothetical protein